LSSCSLLYFNLEPSVKVAEFDRSRTTKAVSLEAALKAARTVVAESGATTVRQRGDFSGVDTMSDPHESPANDRILWSTRGRIRTCDHWLRGPILQGLCGTMGDSDIRLSGRSDPSSSCGWPFRCSENVRTHSVGSAPARPSANAASLPSHMSRVKSAIVVLFIVWALQAVILLPVMWIGGSSGPAMVGAFVFAGVVAATIVAVPFALAESRQRRDRRR